MCTQLLIELCPRALGNKDQGNHPHYFNTRKYAIYIYILIFCLGTGVPRHRDGVVRPYVRTYVRL